MGKNDLTIAEKIELWNLFTAKEEYESELVDQYDRNPYWASKNRNVLVPVISDYLLKNGLNPVYPDNKKFALCITHDIDRLFNNYSARRVIKNGTKNLFNLKLKEFSKTLKDGVRRRINPDYHISEIFKREKKYGAKSSFYFLALSNEEQDHNYDLSEISEIFDEIRQNNGEIGLHGGHLAYDNLSKIKQEKERLESAIGEKVHGYRGHYLKFRTPMTWELLDNVEFKYDTTYGYADCSGFRNGMCHPFHPYSLNKNEFLNIIELPLVIMECSLWKYMGISENRQFDFCKKIIDTVAKNNGVLTLLWHNTEMQGHKGELYSSILKYAHDKKAWMTTGNEIADFWIENKYDEKTKNLLSDLNNDSNTSNLY